MEYQNLLNLERLEECIEKEGIWTKLFKKCKETETYLNEKVNNMKREENKFKEEIKRAKK